MSEVSREEVEAAAKALQAREYESDYEQPCPDRIWDETPHDIKVRWMNTARAALEAAAKVRQKGERVVMQNTTGETVRCMVSPSHLAIEVVSGLEVPNNHELVIRPIGGKEESNGK